jgi:putative ABC transport system permease protein
VWITGFLTGTASEIYNVSLETQTRYTTLQSSAVTVLGMTLLGAIAGFFGARSLTQLAPYRGTRREQKHTQPIEVSRAVAVAAGATLIAAGAMLLLVFTPRSLVAYMSIGAMLVWAGACIPLFVLQASAVLSLVRRYLPVRLAYGALRESGRSFVLSGIAASVAIALLVGLSLMVSSFRETLHRWSATRLAGDIFISSTLAGSGNEGRIPAEVLKTVAALPEVGSVVPYFETITTIGTHTVVIGGVDLSVQCKRNVYSFVAGGCVAPGISWERQAIASESAARKLGVRVGAEVSIAGERYTIRGIVQEFGTEQPLLVINRDSFEKHYREHHPETITVDVVDERTLDLVQTKMRAILPVTVTVRNHSELLNLVETLFNRTFRVTDSVRWIVFIMALLGLVSTTAQHIWSRRRELRVAEVLGISRKRLVCALTIEALVVTVVAVVVGVTAGVGIGWCLTEYINPLVFGWSLAFQVSVWPCIESLVFVAAVGGATALVAARMVRRIVASVGLEDE